MRKFIRAASHSIALLGKVTRANVGAATQCGLVAHRAGLRGPHDVLCRVIIASGVGRCRELGEGTQACTVMLAPRVCFRPGSVAQAATHSRARGAAQHADAYVPTEARACFCRAGAWRQRASRPAGGLAYSAEELAGDVVGLARSSGGDGGGRGKLGCVNGGGESVKVALGQSFTRPSAWPNFSQWSRSLDQSQSSSLPWQNAFSRSG